MKSSIELLDLNSQQIIEVNSDNGGFKVPAGKYRVIAK
jgi:hypothetical protein